MHFATRVRTWRVARLCSVLYSKIALSRKPFGIEHMYIYNFFLRNTGSMTSQNPIFSLGKSCIYPVMSDRYKQPWEKVGVTDSKRRRLRTKWEYFKSHAPSLKLLNSLVYFQRSFPPDLHGLHVSVIMIYNSYFMKYFIELFWYPVVLWQTNGGRSASQPWTQEKQSTPCPMCSRVSCSM
jgi:hypothetical protein